MRNRQIRGVGVGNILFYWFMAVAKVGPWTATSEAGLAGNASSRLLEYLYPRATCWHLLQWPIYFAKKKLRSALHRDPLYVQQWHEISEICRSSKHYTKVYFLPLVRQRAQTMYRSSAKSLAWAEWKQANVSLRMAWISFGALLCRGKKNLLTAGVSMLLKSRASLTCFPACFLPGWAKDLSAPR